ncbi:MAG: ATP-binding protein [Verrucomicrobiota bacterium]
MSKNLSYKEKRAGQDVSQGDPPRRPDGFWGRDLAQIFESVLNHLGLKNLGIRNQLILGFGVVISCFVILGIITSFKLSYLDQSVHRVQNISENSAAIIEINRQVLEVQQLVLLYIYTGQSVKKERALEYKMQIQTQLEDLKTQSLDPETLNYLERMLKHLDSYISNFNEITLERTLQTTLINETLPNLSSRTTVIFNTLNKNLISSNNKSSSSSLVNALNHFLLAKSYTKQFFNNADSSSFRAAKSEIKLAKEELSSIPASLDNQKMIDEAIKSLNEYEASLIRAVQATRAYLYLVNVVMAGEASEFTYNSKQLQEQAVEKLSKIRGDNSAIISFSIFANLALFVTTITLSIIFSFLVAKSIISPLKQITETFTRLINGDKEANITGLDRDDEIGQMAKAADIFKEKNQETEKLLKQFQKLSSDLDDKTTALEQANEEMKMFVYTVSHDLKTPIVSCMGFIGMIRDLAKQGNFDLALKKIDRLESNNHRMNQLISDILDLSQVGRMNQEYEDLDMNELIGDIYNHLSDKFTELGFHVDISSNLPHLQANRSSTTQAFDNILNNAIKYCSNTNSPQIKIRASQDSYETVFSIADNGPGIPEEYHKKVFGLFKRLESKTEGTGIGLAIVSKVMETHKGRVWVESKEGIGSTFWLAFPNQQTDVKIQRN